MENLLWDAVALALILGPGKPEQLPANPPPQLYSALKRQAVGLDLWTFDSWGAFPAEVYWCRNHASWMAELPPSNDWMRFPPARLAELQSQWWATALAHLEARAAWNPKLIDWLPHISQARQQHETWSALARAPCNTIPCRRQALADLRDLIGTDNYQAGIIPHVVPSWCRPAD